jgi:CubicO group peptidase (beta-lactamase class C family)
LANFKTKSGKIFSQKNLLNLLIINHLDKNLIKFLQGVFISTLLICFATCSSPQERASLRLKVKTDSIKTRLFEINQKKLDLIFKHLYQNKLFNGNVLVAEDGKILLKKSFGFANFAEKTPLQFQTPFQIAGITQVFTALAVMQLESAKKLSYDDSLKKFFPEIPFSGISIRHLLTHTSGIPDYLSYFYNTSTKELPYANNQNVLDWLINTQPDAEFIAAQKWAYSSTNYVLLASIVEKITQQKFSNYLKDQIFAPIQLTNSFLPNYNQINQHPERAVGYGAIEGKLMEDHALNYIQGDAGLYASLADLDKLMQALDKPKLLKIKQLDLLAQPVSLTNGRTYPFGLGWHLRLEPRLMYQQGSWLGFQAAVVRIPAQKVTIILLSNCQNPIFGQIVEMTQNLMLNLPYSIPQ